MLDGDLLGDVAKAFVDDTSLRQYRTALFRALGNGIVQHIADGGIAASPEMSTWMGQVGGFAGAATTFAADAVVRAIAPTFSTALVTCTGSPGTVLPVGVVVASETTGDRFQSTAPAVLDDDGTADVPFRAQSSGLVVAAADELTSILTPVEGWDGANNNSDAIPGVPSVSLDGNALGDLMKANIDALSAVQKRDRQEVFRAMGSAIVSHIGDVGVAADPLMAAWQSQVETVINGAVPGSVAPLAATFNVTAIVK